MKEIEKEMLAMRNEGMTFEAIADACGCTRQNVQYRLARAEMLKKEEDTPLNELIQKGAGYETKLQGVIKYKFHSITAFANASGMNYSRIRHIALGEAIPTADEAFYIADVLGVKSMEDERLLFSDMKKA